MFVVNFISSIGSFFCAGPRSNTKTRADQVRQGLNSPPSNTTKLVEVTNQIGKGSLPQTQRTASKPVASNCKPGFSIKQNEHQHNLYLFFTQNVSNISNSSRIDIRNLLTYCSSRSSNNNLSANEKIQFRALFDALAKLPSDKFDALRDLGGQAALHRVLSPELDALLSQQEQSPTLKNNKDFQLQIAKAKADLALKMGVQPKQAGGCNGAKLLLDLDGKYVGIFKGEKHVALTNLTEQGKKVVGQARLFNNRKDSLNEAFSEIAVFKFAGILNLSHLVPTAMMTTFGGEEGAFIEFLPGYKELADVSQDLDKRSSYSNAELSKWQEAILLGFGSLNFDWHPENFFTKVEKEKLLDVKLIDGGNAFVAQLPGEWGAKGHRASPAQFKISQQPFLSEMIDFVAKTFTQANLDSFINKIKQDRPGYFTPEMISLLSKTFEVMRVGIVETKTIRTPAELVQVITDAQYAQILSKSTKTVPMQKVEFSAQPVLAKTNATKPASQPIKLKVVEPKVVKPITIQQLGIVLDGLEKSNQPMGSSDLMGSSLMSSWLAL